VLSGIDLGVIGLYLGALSLLGVALSHRKTNASDFFLASRKASWAAVGLSLFGTNVSPGVLIGLTGSAYAFGISVYNYDWMATVVLAVFALFFLPAVLASRVYTMPEFLERRYDGRVRLWFSALTLLLYVLLDAAGALYCGVLVLHLLLPGIDAQTAILILVGLALVYSVAGGLRAVLYTQAAQAITILLSALCLAGFAFAAAGGWHTVMSAAPPDFLKLIRPADDPLMPWTGLLFGAPILAFYFWCTNQVMVQRMLAARSIEDGQKGALFAGLLKLTTLFLIVLPGIAGLKLFPHLAHGDEVYLKLAFAVLPPGLLGLLLAAFLGALMAQLAASAHSAATLVSIDFFKRIRPEASEKTLVRWGRMATLICMVIAALWAPQITRFPSLWQYFQAVLAYATPPVVALFLGGLLWQRANATGAVWAVAAGSATGLCLFALSAAQVSHLQFLNAAALVFAVSAAALVAGSLIGPEEREKWERFHTLTRNTLPGAENPLRSALGKWALLLMAVTAFVVIAFR